MTDLRTDVRGSVSRTRLWSGSRRAEGLSVFTVLFIRFSLLSYVILKRSLSLFIFSLHLNWCKETACVWVVQMQGCLGQPRCRVQLQDTGTPCPLVHLVFRWLMPVTQLWFWSSCPRPYWSVKQCTSLFTSHGGDSHQLGALLRGSELVWHFAQSGLLVFQIHL